MQENNFAGVVQLQSKAQFRELVANGSITIGDRTIVYNPLTTIYLYESHFIEKHDIESIAWTELDDSELPYKYSTTITLTTTIFSDSMVELLNNQLVLFANYGFAINTINVSEQTATIYAIDKPSSTVTLQMEVTP